MIYIIKDVVVDLFGYTKITVVKTSKYEADVLKFLSDQSNLKKFKGDIKVEKVVL